MSIQNHYIYIWVIFNLQRLNTDGLYIYIETFSPCRHHCRACSTAQVGSGKHNQLHVLIKLVILCKYLYIYIAVVIFIMNETEATCLQPTRGSRQRYYLRLVCVISWLLLFIDI